MTIEQAVETLNRHKWRERDDWHQYTESVPKPGQENYKLPLPDIRSWSGYVIHLEDAIAIASWLELREAVRKALAALKESQ
jgi:hypothetical protein